jgi:hypothetical protein
MASKHSDWHDEIGDTLNVRVTTKASANSIRVENNPDGSKLIRINITTVPEDGKANAAVIKLLSKELGISKSSFTITRGLTSRNKIIHIQK